MTNMSHKTPLSRTRVQIPTVSSDAIEAWVYLPEGNGPHPAVVMAHGIGGIKAGGLAPFAERFREEGFAAPSPSITATSAVSAGSRGRGLSSPRHRGATAPASAGALHSPPSTPAR